MCFADTEKRQNQMVQHDQNLYFEDLINRITSKEAGKKSHTALDKCEPMSEVSPCKKDKSTYHKDHTTKETDNQLTSTESCT